ncbi:MAG: 50S ribosomal protein L10 [Fimbriiglobus sp.]|nr:50S ribosomal protein L10 [Fimbriiglobus sp.]
MSKAIKQLELDDLRKQFNGVKDYVLLEPIKLDSATEYNFRKALRGHKVRVKLVKNSYAKKVFAEMGVSAPALSGPTLVCWGAESPKGLGTAVDTAVRESKKDPKAPDKLKVRTGIVEGAPMPLDAMKNVPTRLEAIGEIVAAVTGPGSAIAGALTGPASQLASILKAIEEKTPDAAPAA